MTSEPAGKDDDKENAPAEIDAKTTNIIKNITSEPAGKFDDKENSPAEIDAKTTNIITTSKRKRRLVQSPSVNQPSPKSLSHGGENDGVKCGNCHREGFVHESNDRYICRTNFSVATPCCGTNDCFLVAKKCKVHKLCTGKVLSMNPTIDTSAEMTFRWQHLAVRPTTASL
uniref:uncharacterized protein LOC113475225 n=1 Tax=Ciona intestinalis TaxID=7719 RepID=UPI000EF4C7E5|nr:uncharacterized protein LOC113475225 [Ciona intestinalis]|eukprot:XP_026694969.1 uncharacterized protein LOC113475225 [Ciona intestinalis]